MFVKVNKNDRVKPRKYTKHVVHNFIVAFRRFLLSTENDNYILKFTNYCDIKHFRIDWNLFYKTIKFNNSLMKSLLLHKDYG
jgi:hypothetical protein